MTTLRPRIGLEVHALLASPRKLLSRAYQTGGWLGFDAAWPGSLPMLNSEPIIQALRVSMALGCEISKYFWFDRKQYFYHDLPAGYQLTQKYQPLALNGKLSLLPSFDHGLELDVGISRLQLEQDTMRTMEADQDMNVCIDASRANAALLEIVTEPDISSAKEAVEVIKKLAILLKTIGASSADMDQGSLRVDVNVSLGENGTPCELKNLVSLKLIYLAIDAEIRRQTEILLLDRSVEASTRSFGMKKQSEATTNLLRVKENHRDYKFFEDPEIPRVMICPKILDKVRTTLPMLPDVAKKKLTTDYGLDSKHANILVDSGGSALFFKLAARPTPTIAPTPLANFIINTLFGALHEKAVGIESLHQFITIEMLVELLDAMGKKRIHYHQAKNILELWLSHDKTSDRFLSLAETIRKNPKLSGTTSHVYLEHQIRQIFEENPKLLRDIQKKPRALNFICGKIMRQIDGQADPSLLISSVLRVLEGFGRK